MRPRLILPFSIIVLRYTHLPALIMRSTVVELPGKDFVYYHRTTCIPSRSQVANLVKHLSPYHPAVPYFDHAGHQRNGSP